MVIVLLLDYTLLKTHVEGVYRGKERSEVPDSFTAVGFLLSRARKHGQKVQNYARVQDR